MDINGRRCVVSLDRWAKLPYWHIGATQEREALCVPSFDHWVIAVLWLAVAAVSGIAFILAFMISAVRWRLNCRRW